VLTGTSESSCDVTGLIEILEKTWPEILIVLDWEDLNEFFRADRFRQREADSTDTAAQKQRLICTATPVIDRNPAITLCWRHPNPVLAKEHPQNASFPVPVR